ncbi:Uncharacterised protein [Mycobacterium tuberculosis]|uniref:Uncharacterized protein n=1 Tax=Mycobacterium tuberculosis TaxID=1773 RepID=A0A654ZHZ4_MYCTX|nr:Uncharacterised protein [Mycobacterium tuberculosis]COW56293.1 Uncharacterised protein [Mycobacterium tuberculosis]COX64748.1 Uncharacterised protein [Mycobacterium tuberculosis]COX81431.1 Uncharacterised protein [Mycobacterium tuberculosis]
MPDGDGRPDVIDDGLVVELMRAGRPFADDHQLLGGVLGVEFQPGVRVVEHCLRKLVGRNREGRRVANPQRLGRLLRRALEILWVVIAAVDDDEVLDPAGYVEVVLEVGAVVAGTHPQRVVWGALGARLADPRFEDVLEGLGGLFFFAPITGTQVVAVQPDLTDLSVRQFAGRVGVDDDRPFADPDLARRDLGDGVGCIGGHLNEPLVVQLVAVHVDHGGHLVHRRGRDEQRGLR